MPLHDYARYFPFDSIRDEQKKAIEFALDAYESGKRYVLLEAGTGIGKSAIAITISRYLENHGGQTVDDTGVITTGAYVLTTQKVLQQQYVDDFGQGTGRGKNLLRSIKSASNYTCGFYADQSCGESRRVLHQLKEQLIGTEFHKKCTNNCRYANEKRAFIESPIGITNFSYFLAETMYAKKLLPRATLVVDECHNIETELSKFIEVTLSEKFARDVLKCKPPKTTDQRTVFDWITKVYKKKLVSYLKNLEKLMGSSYVGLVSANIDNKKEHARQYEMLDKHLCKVNRFIATYSDDNWVLNVVEPMGKKAGTKFEFKPVDVARYSYEHLFSFGGRTLMLSATVINKEAFCRSVGLDPQEVAYINLPSPFPKENRPVHYVPTGSMSKGNIENTLPIMVEAVRMLLEKHANEKGIIHCVNYKISQFIQQNVKSDRLLTHTSADRDAILKKHLESAEPTVLLSPSMMEGVNLADDASRFQILCKVPFPYLGDEMVKKRMSRDKVWYSYQTVKTIVQAMGRSVRNHDDYAVSYILDSDWERFFRTNSGMFPSEFSISTQ